MSQGRVPFLGRYLNCSENVGYVYVLQCPDTRLVRYVGLTRNWKARKASHSIALPKPTTPVQKWTTALALIGKRPIFRVVVRIQAPGLSLGGTCFIQSRALTTMAEKEVIERARLAGCDLLNVDLVERFKTRKPRSKVTT